MISTLIKLLIAAMIFAFIPHSIVKNNIPQIADFHKTISNTVKPLNDFAVSLINNTQEKNEAEAKAAAK